jgi:predicted O-methyltransferase YrrM
VGHDGAGGARIVPSLHAIAKKNILTPVPSAGGGASVDTRRVLIDIARAKTIEGWMSTRELEWLASTATECQAIIEIGCWLGRATRVLGDHCPGVVYSVDPWDGDYHNDDGTVAKWLLKRGRTWADVFRQFTDNLEDLIAIERVRPIRASSVDAWSALVDELPRGGVDLVFVDGDHRRESVARDIALYRELVRAGGIIAGHDYGRADWPGVQAAVDEAFPGCNLAGTIWWTRL